MDVSKLREPLSIEDVDFRVQSVSAKGYITILAYKDARVDMDRLDKVVGAMNWKREHTRDNKNCIVSIWDESKKQWVSKEDTGAESFSEKEKGLASDSFKRACFNWGIGIELYDYPFIFFQLYPNEFKAENGKAKTTFDFNLKKWSWEVNTDKGIRLIGKDNNGRIRFDSLKDFNGIPNQPQVNTPTPTPPQQPQPKPKAKLKMDAELYGKAIASTNIESLEKALKVYDLTQDQSGNIAIRIKELKEATKTK